MDVGTFLRRSFDNRNTGAPASKDLTKLYSTSRLYWYQWRRQKNHSRVAKRRCPIWYYSYRKQHPLDRLEEVRSLNQTSIRMMFSQEQGSGCRQDDRHQTAAGALHAGPSWQTVWSGQCSGGVSQPDQHLSGELNMNTTCYPLIQMK